MAKVAKAKLVQTEIPDATDSLDVVFNEGSQLTLSNDVEWGSLVVDEGKVLESKRFCKGLIEYSAPRDIFRPVYNLLSKIPGVAMVVDGSGEIVNANDDSTKNVSYGRLRMEALFKYDDVTEYDYRIGIMVAYDTPKPQVKIYAGTKVHTCMNLAVWGAEDYVKSDITDGVSIGYIDMVLKDIVNKKQKAFEIITRLKNITLSLEQVNRLLGEMIIWDAENKSMINTAIYAGVKELTKEPVKGQVSYNYRQENFNAWQFYNAFTVYMNQRINFFDIPDKAREVTHMVTDLLLK